MAYFLINGGKTLSGEISVSGSKNAALPIIFASFAMGGVSSVTNVPDISDVSVALGLLEELGAVITRCGKTLVIDARSSVYKEPNEKLVKKIRASSYLIGAMLVRFGKAPIQAFGGCNFGTRPIDMHLYAAERLGAKRDSDFVFAEKLCGNDIYFDKASVGATINALIMASGAHGVTRIYGYAREPHVFSLVRFLSTSGIKVCKTFEYIEVEGGAGIGGKIALIPDMIEAGTYIALSLLLNSELLIKDSDPKHLSSFFSVLKKAGAEFKINEDGIIPYGKITAPIDIETRPYPGFPTDLQPLIAPLMAKFHGGTVTERVFRGRFAYLDELKAFGVKSENDGDMAKIYSSEIKCANAYAPDLRGGAALVLTALSAEGESVINNADLVFRGYENFVEKIRSLGGKIERIT